MIRVKWMVLGLLYIVMMTQTAVAEDFDGSKPLLCSVIETFECGPGGECQRGTAESIDIPQFLKISFNEKIISSTPESGQVRTTKIKAMERVDGKLILQGVQNGKAWSMIIKETTGKVSLSGSDDQVGFIVFGACTAL
jgi:hypothetical protein